MNSAQSQLLCTLMLGIVLATHALVPQAEEKTSKIRLYNWQEYMPQSVLDAFKEKSGYSVEQVYYENDELKEDLLQATQGEGLDLVIGSAASFTVYVQQGNLLSELSQEMPNLKNIDPRWQTQHPQLVKHAVPFLWGTLGIAYRTDKVQGKVDSWAQLLRPDPALKGKIMMVEDMRDLFTPALKLLGYSTNATDRKAIDQAADLLESQKEFVATYKYIDLTETSELLTGTAWMALAYNGDALGLAAMSPQIAFVVPKEGTNVWVDYIAVLQASRNQEVAMSFIDFINQPEVAAQIATELYYASPNRQARKLIAEDMLNNPLIYPPDEVLEKSESIHPIQGRAAVYYNHRFGNLMQ